MGFINTRQMATSFPRNFRRGLPLFPLTSTINTPAFTQDIGGGSPSLEQFARPLINDRFAFAHWRVTARIDLSAFVGSFFGFNLEYLVSGVTNNDGTGFVGLSGDRIAGGIGFGVSIQVSGRVRVEEFRRQRLTFNLQNGLTWQRAWEEALNRAFSFNVDPINLALTVLRSATGGVLPIEIVQGASRIGSAGAVWGLFDERRDQLVNGGRMTLRPNINFSPNILNIIPEMRAVLKAFRLIGLRLSMGPTLNLVYPISFEVVRIVTEDGSYNITTRSTTLGLANGPVRTLPPTVSSLTVIHSHTWSLTFHLGMHFSFSFLSLVRLDQTTTFPVPFAPLLNVLGPFFTALNDSNVVASADQEELPEVVWG